MKPKVTFTATGNSYDLNLPTGATNISNSPPKYTTTQTNYVSGASGARLTSGGIYNTNQGLTINNNINRPLTTNITTTSQANIVSQPSYMTTGYAAPASGRYTSTVANQGGQITTKYVQPSVQTYATQQVNVPVQQYQVQQVQQVQQVPIQTVQTQAINLQPVVASTPTLPPATTPIAVSQVQRFDNIKTSQVNRVQSQQVIEEYERPHYNKIYNNPRLEERKQAPLTEEPTRTGSCCGLPCWILLGLLGLAGLILGLLFGLGVLGRSGASTDMGAASNTNGTSTNGTGINGTAIINGTGTNGSGVINGSGTTNGGIVINGTGGNGAVSINGTGTTNGTVSINGTGTINATGTTNGTVSINGTGTTNGSSFINGTSTNGSAVINGSAAINGSSSLINGSSFQVPQGQIIEEQQVFVPPTIIEPQIYQFNYTQPQEVPAVQVKPTITSSTAQTGSNQTLSSTLVLKDSSAITRPESSDVVKIASNQTNLRHQGSVQHELTPVSNLDVY